MFNTTQQFERDKLMISRDMLLSVTKCAQDWVGAHPWHPHGLICTLSECHWALSLSMLTRWPLCHSMLSASSQPTPPLSSLSPLLSLLNRIIIMRRLPPFWSNNVSSHISQEQSHISECFQRAMEDKHLLGVMAKFQVSTISRRVDNEF